MKLSEVQFGALVPVDGYGPGFFRVGGAVLHGPVLVRPDGGGAWGGLDDAAALLALAGSVDVIFCGMGAEIAPLPRALREALEAEGLGVEIMATPAACRTYNVCLAEGRRVAAALLPL
ncbi:Mth938-like domain-containing protein [Gemmobacter nectariphilus]|uniref:Mth938-like domain-containing protein n=1 Tax=Gemmobacter nectariphilus TaxID=220343 RepID=UPI000424D8E5|nr:Mth938-like domain-containing protein [Gemmobacter nectariphilus]